jgi:hypothetical protein
MLAEYSVIWQKLLIVCINHEILITKLHFIGIQRTVLSWFRSYLTEREKKTEIKSSLSIQSTYSNWGSIKHGVPQGPILGPLPLNFKL